MRVRDARELWISPFVLSGVLVPLPSPPSAPFHPTRVEFIWATETDPRSFFPSDYPVMRNHGRLGSSLAAVRPFPPLLATALVLGF